MTAAVRQVLDSFDHLGEEEKREAALEILRRAASFNLPTLSDDELSSSADVLFARLDDEEEAAS